MTAEELVTLRRQLGYTQADMARWLGFSSWENYHRLETGMRRITSRNELIIRRLKKRRKKAPHPLDTYP